jgi:carboxypeptidase Taq
MKTTQSRYNLLLEKGKEIQVLKSISTLVGWDQETYMPKDGIGIRSTQKQYLEGLIHKEITSLEFQELLDYFIDLDTGAFKNIEGLDETQKAAIREWRVDVVKAKKLPDNFVKTFAKVTSETVSIWGEARKNNDFKMFAPHLEKIVELARERAKYLGYKEHPYDALLDEYEPGMTVKTLDKLFSGLKSFLIDLTKRLSSNNAETSFLYGEFDESKMFNFDNLILKQMGFKENSYRLDTSNHPFCLSLHPTDVRMTTVTKTTDLFAANISSVIHEAGHGLYEQGLDETLFGTPLCEALSMGIHESQSKLWECFLGQSLPFWAYFYPSLQETFPKHFNSISLDTFYKAINQITPSFIRIYADEVTYSLHVILRYELEKALLEGSLQVKDIPEAWNEKMQKYLQITPKNYKEGCMQDIHWAWGLFGYFPTYALGNLYAAQLFQTIKEKFPDWKERVSQGHLLFVRDFLRENVHRHGRFYTPDELIRHATGSSLNEQFFKDYLEEKYLNNVLATSS